MCPILLWRGRVLILASLLPIGLLFYSSEAILLFFKQDPHVSHYAKVYLMVAFPKVAVFGLFDCQRKWLNGFGKNYMPMLCQGLFLPIHYKMSEYFVQDLELGLPGIGLAGFITFSVVLLLLQCFDPLRNLGSGDESTNLNSTNHAIFDQNSFL